MRIRKAQPRAGYVFFASAIALVGCAGLLGISDRTLDPLDGSVPASEGDAVLDSSLGRDAFASETGNAESGEDAQAGVDVPGLVDSRDASDAGRVSDGAGVDDASSGGDRRVGSDASGNGDAQICGDGPASGDARGGGDAEGGDAQGGGDAPFDAGVCADPCRIQTGLNHPFLIASDANRVYWTEFGDDWGTANGAVKSCPIAGCGSGETVYTSSQINPRGIAVDGQNVYWGSASYGGVVGAIWSCPIGGCTSPTKLASANIPYGVAVDSTYVYWVDNNDNTVHRVAKTNGTDAVLYDAGSSALIEPGQCAVDTTFVYVSDRNNTVARLPVTGGEPVVIASGQRGGYFGVTTSATDVYFGESGQILSAAKTATDSGIPIWSNVPWPVGLALDPATSTLYWADYGSGSANDGTVGRVGIDGGGATVLAASLVSPEGVTVTGGSIFWISWGTLDPTSTTTGALPRTGALFRTSK